MEIHLKELDGVMCGIQLSYQAKRQGEDGTETYEVEEDFTMKWNELRIYMMQYEPHRESDLFRGPQRIFRKENPAGHYRGRPCGTGKERWRKGFAYRVNRDLWSYDPADRPRRESLFLPG